MANILHPFHGIGFIHVYFLLLLVSYTFAQGNNNNNNNNNGSGPPNPYGLDASFNPSMAIIIIVLITAFFFMGFFSIYIRHCARARRTDRSMRATNANTGRSRRGQRGLDPTVIETFPTFLYSIVKGLKIGKGSLECAVCLNEFEDDEILRLLPKCDHVFHPECIDAWLASHTTCPVCRANLAVIDDSAATDVAIAAESANQLSESASESESDHENIRPPQAESVHGEVCINVSADPQQTSPEVINPTLLPAQNRPVRNKSTRKKISGKFPRSHSTGHSLVQPGENCDRFTLRLPDEVRKQIMLSQTTSCVAFPRGDRSFSRRSSRRGYRGSDTGPGPDGSSRGSFWRLDQRVDQERAKSDRWVFSMAPPFLSRGASVKSTKGGVDGSFLTSVKTPFDCLSAKEVDTKEQSSSTESRPPV